MNKIKKAIQRAKKGYCDEDLWDIGYWFLNTVPKMLDEFANQTIGFPGYFLTDGEDEDVAFEKWKNIIKEISFHFKEGLEPTKEINECYCPIHDTIEDIVREFNEEEQKQFDKWAAREDEIEKYKEQEIKKGFEMFNEYFQNLWW